MNGHGKGRLMAIAGRLGAAAAAALLVVLGLAVPAFAQTTTGTALGSSPNPSNVGQSVTFTATVTPTPDGGTVAFSGGGISRLRYPGTYLRRGDLHHLGPCGRQQSDHHRRLQR